MPALLNFSPCNSEAIFFGDTPRPPTRSRGSRLDREGYEDFEAEDVEGRHPSRDQAPPVLREAVGEAEAQDARGAQATPSRAKAPRDPLAPRPLREGPQASGMNDDGTPMTERRRSWLEVQVETAPEAAEIMTAELTE